MKKVAPLTRSGPLGLKLAWLILRKNPAQSFFAIIALSFTGTLAWVAGSVGKEAALVKHSAQKTVWVLMSFSKEPDADVAYNKIKTESELKPMILKQQQVIEQLGKVDQSLGQLLGGLGNETAAVVPTLVSVSGQISNLKVDEFRNFPGLIKIESKPLFHEKLLEFIDSIEKTVRFTTLGLMFGAWVILVLLSTVYRSQYRFIHTLLLEGGVTAIRASMPLLVALIVVVGLGFIGSLLGWGLLQDAFFGEKGVFSALLQAGMQTGTHSFSWSSVMMLIGSEITVAILFALGRLKRLQ